MSKKFDESVYNENYYQSSFGGIPYDRESSNGYWLNFFSTIANNIIQHENPKRVLDVGCAKGFIVESLRDNGINAFGVDISETAISQIREDIKQYCKIGSIDNPNMYDGLYDLIICIEVVEHITEEMAENAIGIMCNHTDQILFSSSPSDFEEPTHINVQQPEYWENIFAKFGFTKSTVSWPTTVIASHTVVFRRKQLEDQRVNSARLVNIDNHIIGLLEKITEQANAALLDKSNIISILEQMEKLEYVIKEKDKTILEKEATIQDKERHIQNIEYLLNALQKTKGWIILEKIRRIKNFVFLHKWRAVRLAVAKVKERGISGTLQLIDEKLDNIDKYHVYDEWYRKTILTNSQINQIKEEILRFEDTPTISIVMPAYNTDEVWLRKAIESVINQIYPYWELCICDDYSPNSIVWNVLKEYSEIDNRIKVTRPNHNLGIAGATNKAIELVTGSYVGFLDHDDELTNDALFEVAKEIIKSKADMVYSDEDKLELNDQYSEPFFKPDWSPDYLNSTNYICHFAVYKKEIGDKIGWIRLGYDGAQDYDFVLRFTEITKNIAHISKILYHWRKIPGSTAESFGSKSYANDAGLRALESARERRDISGKVSLNKASGHYRLERKLIEQPLVSIIIPTKDKVDLLKVCIKSIVEKSSYRNFEILIVDNNSVEDKTFKYFVELERELKDKIKIIDYKQTFNYSAINNEAVKHSNGSILLFLNNDTEVISKDWLEAMLEHAQRDEVGIVGAKLLYTNNTIQHAGVVLGVGGVANHAFLHNHKDADGYFGMLNDTKNYSAVTAACMMIRRDVFENSGGFNEKYLPVAFNDIDLCLKVRSLNYLCIWTPYAVLYHHESATRTRDVDLKEVEYMRRTWDYLLDNDPYYNKNFDRNEVIKSYSKLR